MDSDIFYHSESLLKHYKINLFERKSIVMDLADSLLNEPITGKSIKELETLITGLEGEVDKTLTYLADPGYGEAALEILEEDLEKYQRRIKKIKSKIEEMKGEKTFQTQIDEAKQQKARNEVIRRKLQAKTAAVQETNDMAEIMKHFDSLESLVVSDKSLENTIQFVQDQEITETLRNINREQTNHMEDQDLGTSSGINRARQLAMRTLELGKIDTSPSKKNNNPNSFRCRMFVGKTEQKCPYRSNNFNNRNRHESIVHPKGTYHTI